MTKMMETIPRHTGVFRRKSGKFNSELRMANEQRAGSFDQILLEPAVAVVAMVVRKVDNDEGKLKIECCTTYLKTSSQGSIRAHSSCQPWLTSGSWRL